MTSYDVVEAMHEGDCFCLGLDIARSEACIADPSKLVIRKIIPTFITSEGFLDSAEYYLRKDEMAHSGFDKSHDGKLAEGYSRESITGVMPLYLFRDHWKIARRKCPLAFGFMCTCDIMGFTSL